MKKDLSNMATNAHALSMVSLEVNTLGLGLDPRSKRPKSHFPSLSYTSATFSSHFLYPTVHDRQKLSTTRGKILLQEEAPPGPK